MDRDEMLRALSAFADAGVEYILVGAAAMGVHGMRGGVQRFRSVSEMAEAAILSPPGEGFDRFARQCQQYFALAPRVYPRGVFRFRSIEEAQAARAQVTEENLRRLR